MTQLAATSLNKTHYHHQFFSQSQGRSQSFFQQVRQAKVSYNVTMKLQGYEILSIQGSTCLRVIDHLFKKKDRWREEVYHNLRYAMIHSDKESTFTKVRFYMLRGLRHFLTCQHRPKGKIVKLLALMSPRIHRMWSETSTF